MNNESMKLNLKSFRISYLYVASKEMGKFFLRWVSRWYPFVITKRRLALPRHASNVSQIASDKAHKTVFEI